MTKSEELFKKLRNSGPQMHLGEFLYNLCGVTKSEDRVELIKEYGNKSSGNKNAILLFGNAMWREGAQMDLPQGTPPYKAGQFKEGYEFAPTNLQRELLKYSYFVKGSPKYLSNSVKRETVFIGILESMHPNDVELMLAIKERKAPKNIKHADFFKAYPELFPWMEKLGK